MNTNLETFKVLFFVYVYSLHSYEASNMLDITIIPLLCS